MCHGPASCQLAGALGTTLPSGVPRFTPRRREPPLPGGTQEPLDIARRVIGVLMVGGTVVAVGLALTGVAPRAWMLAGAIWALYGLVVGLLDGILEPMIDGLARALTNVGFSGRQGFSEIETLEARGEHAFAAERYRERAERDPADRAAATVRRATLLAGPLADPGRAVMELLALRAGAGHRLTAGEDILIGTTLAHLYEQRLDQPGKAMGELRRLLDRYPGSSHARYLRRSLAGLRDVRFDRDAEATP